MKPEIAGFADAGCHVKRAWKHRTQVADIEPNPDLRNAWADDANLSPLPLLNALQALLVTLNKQDSAADCRRAFAGFVLWSGLSRYVGQVLDPELKSLEHLGVLSESQLGRVSSAHVLLAELLKSAQPDSPAHLRIVRIPLGNPQGKLTGREMDVLRGVVAGLTCPQIAAQLGIGRRTVECHRSKLSRKLGLRGTAELTRYALKHDLV